MATMKSQRTTINTAPCFHCQWISERIKLTCKIAGIELLCDKDSSNIHSVALKNQLPRQLVNRENADQNNDLANHFHGITEPQSVRHQNADQYMQLVGNTALTSSATSKKVPVSGPFGLNVVSCVQSSAAAKVGSEILSDHGVSGPCALQENISSLRSFDGINTSPGKHMHTKVSEQAHDSLCVAPVLDDAELSKNSPKTNRLVSTILTSWDTGRANTVEAMNDIVQFPTTSTSWYSSAKAASSNMSMNVGVDRCSQQGVDVLKVVVEKTGAHKHKASSRIEFSNIARPSTTKNVCNKLQGNLSWTSQLNKTAVNKLQKPSCDSPSQTTMLQCGSNSGPSSPFKKAEESQDQRPHGQKSDHVKRLTRILLRSPTKHWHKKHTVNWKRKLKSITKQLKLSSNLKQKSYTNFVSSVSVGNLTNESKSSNRRSQFSSGKWVVTRIRGNISNNSQEICTPVIQIDGSDNFQNPCAGWKNSTSSGSNTASEHDLIISVSGSEGEAEEASGLVLGSMATDVEKAENWKVCGTKCKKNHTVELSPLFTRDEVSVYFKSSDSDSSLPCNQRALQRSCNSGGHQKGLKWRFFPKVKGKFGLFW